MIRVCNNRHWRMDGGHTRLKVKAEFSYSDDGMVDSTNLVWLQTEFYTLMGLFDWVGLNKNEQKKVGMVCHSC